MVSLLPSLPFWSLAFHANSRLEPDGLANLITNMEVEKCAEAADAYTESTVYALSELDLENVAIYIDAGHTGWLGWPVSVTKDSPAYVGVELTSESRTT